MSDGRLIDYYKEYAPLRFRTAAGDPVKRRSQQIIAKRLNLPLIRAGGSVLVDPQEADDVLRSHARSQDMPSRRRRVPATSPPLPELPTPGVLTTEHDGSAAPPP